MAETPTLRKFYSSEHLREIAAYIRHLEARVAALEARGQPTTPPAVRAITAHHAGFGRYEVRDERDIRIAPADGWYTKAEAAEYVAYALGKNKMGEQNHD